MKPDIEKISKLIIENLSDDLLAPARRRDKENRLACGQEISPVFAHCSVATETLWQVLGGSKQKDYKLMQINHEGDSHWYLLGPKSKVIDLTADQFKRIPDYSKGRGKGLPTPIKGSPPSLRARKLMARIGYPAHENKTN